MNRLNLAVSATLSVLVSSICSVHSSGCIIAFGSGLVRDDSGRWAPSDRACGNDLAFMVQALDFDGREVKHVDTLECGTVTVSEVLNAVELVEQATSTCQDEGAPSFAVVGVDLDTFDLDQRKIVVGAMERLTVSPNTVVVVKDESVGIRGSVRVAAAQHPIEQCSVSATGLKIGVVPMIAVSSLAVVFMISITALSAAIVASSNRPSSKRSKDEGEPFRMPPPPPTPPTSIEPPRSEFAEYPASMPGRMTSASVPFAPSFRAMSCPERRSFCESSVSVRR